jgi:ferrochelatase
VTLALVLMAYGSPNRPDEIEEYYTHIRHGRPPSAEQVDELRRRYEAIGGVSPLRDRTEAQARGVHAALEAVEPGRWRVVLGMKHAHPFVEDAAAAALAGHPERVIGLPLTPLATDASTGEYRDRLRRAVGDAAPCHEVEGWHAHPALVGLLAERVQEARERVPPGSPVVFTAHSLPARVVDAGDPYPELLEQAARAIAQATGPAVTHRVAYQSAGLTADPWLGPDIGDVIDELAAGGEVGGVVVCPIGFVSDHLEVLYDIDVVARERARAAGLELVRTRSLNDEPRFVELLADLARRAVPR